MKLGLLAAMILLTGCVAPRAYPPAPAGSRSTTSQSRIPSAETGGMDTFSRDAYECERAAVMSGVAGSKAEVFNKCMKAKGHTPGR
jgi:hypothetical protein